MQNIVCKYRTMGNAIFITLFLLWHYPDVAPGKRTKAILWESVIERRKFALAFYIL